MLIDLSFLLSPLDKLLTYSQRERHFTQKRDDEQSSQKRAALEAILYALLETRKYQELSVDKPDREAEYRLSQLWGIASIKAQGIFDIHDEAYEKQRYWADQLKWPQDVVISKGIDLSAMEEKYRALLIEF